MEAVATDDDESPADSGATRENRVESADEPPTHAELIAFDSASDLAAEIEAELAAESQAAFGATPPGDENVPRTAAAEPESEAKALDEAEESPILPPFPSREGR